MLLLLVAPFRAVQPSRLTRRARAKPIAWELELGPSASRREALVKVPVEKQDRKMRALALFIYYVPSATASVTPLIRRPLFELQRSSAPLLDRLISCAHANVFDELPSVGKYSRSS